MSSLPLFIIGTGTQAKAAFEIFQANQRLLYGFLSEHEEGEGRELCGVPILGAVSDPALFGLCPQDVHPFIALEHPAAIEAFLEEYPKLRACPMPNAIHPEAWLGKSLTMGKGNMLLPGVSIHMESLIGSYNHIKAQAIIGIGAKIGDYVSLGEQVVLGAGVEVGDKVNIGAQCIIAPELSIKAGTSIPPRSIITSNI